MKYVAVVKYSKMAIPDAKEFATKEEAEAFCKFKEEKNPYVRWTKIEEKSEVSADLVNDPALKSILRGKA